MNKKGFTLVELMAVIAIMIFIGLIVTPEVFDIINDNRNKGYLEIERRLEEAAAKYITNEYIDSSVDSIIITKEELINKGYIKEVYDLKDNSVCDASIYAYNLNSVAEFNSILTCSSYETKGKNAVWYISELYNDEVELNNGLINPKVTYNEVEYDAGIRYVGVNPGNKVYYNCDDVDSAGNAYGRENYDYANSCEVWRIIGVFDVDNGSGKVEKRVKIINTASTFQASWDSSASTVNSGYGINQWGESGSYEGADLMNLLNGYYIGKSGSECKYCIGQGQEHCNQSCTNESLKSSNMKVLTSTAKRMTESAVWDTYGVSWPLDDVRDLSWVPTAYLEEKGISTQYTGKICNASNTYEGKYICTDTVERTTSWTSLVGLMSVSDITYADGWLHNVTLYPWSISPQAYSSVAELVWVGGSDLVVNAHAYMQLGVWPSLYLKSSVKMTSGNGVDEPYTLEI